MAQATVGFSGADLVLVFENAVAQVLDRAIAQEMIVPLTTGDLLAAVGEFTPSSEAWFEMARRNLRDGRRGVMDPKVLLGNR